ncbi:MAG: hypothetical protein ACP5SP_07945, partial [Caldisericum sp.]
MLEEKMVFEIQIFHSEGLSISAIARRLGIAPNTVRKYLTRERCQMEKHSKLDSFKSYIISRLNEYPEITSMVLLKEINAVGYTSKITTRVFVHSIRPSKLVTISKYILGIFLPKHINESQVASEVMSSQSTMSRALSRSPLTEILSARIAFLKDFINSIRQEPKYLILDET